jgi:dihydrodipicolinate synthase/N-acetylneuraminate lyase
MEFGFGVPLVTPTDDTGEVDLASTTKLWDHMFPLVDVPVVLGTTGRGRFVLNQDLSRAKRLVDLGIELSKKHGKPLVVGTGAETLDRAMDLTAYAGSRDVFAVLVTAPVHASSAFAQSLAKSPLAPEYQERLVERYFRKVLQAIPAGSSTTFLPYIFPTMTDADPRASLRPEMLQELRRLAEASGHPMGGGKLTLSDDAVALDYAERCPELSFQAGMDTTVRAFLANPRLRFSGAILGSGNLIPKFLRSHVHDCMRLRELRLREQGSDETARLSRKTIRQQNQVDALFSHLWESGLFGPLIHGFLGVGAPYQGVRVPADELAAWARAIAGDAPALVPEVASYCPESPLSQEVLKHARG